MKSRVIQSSPQSSPRIRLTRGLTASRVAVVLALQLFCAAASSADIASDLIGGTCTNNGGQYYCKSLDIHSMTINWSGFTPNAHVRLYTASGGELVAVGTGPTGEGQAYSEGDPGGMWLIHLYRPQFGENIPNRVVVDLRAAYAVISGDPLGVRYAATGGRLMTETDFVGPEACQCSSENIVVDNLFFNFTGRATTPADENQTKGCDANTGCSGPGCSEDPMARYSIHLLLASLHIEDTPISYNSPRGPSTDFKVVYNQREANQPTTFDHSNLGPKWTFNWLSYVTDDPEDDQVNPTVYVRGGGTEVFSGFDPVTQSYAADRQTLAVLVRMLDGTYEKRFPDGSKEVFGRSDEATTYPRRFFLTEVKDPAGNSTELTYDKVLRIRRITDSLGKTTELSHNDPVDQWKITSVIDPFGRFALFEYNSGRLSKITDPIGIQSQFEYEGGSDFINKMITPYGETRFRQGDGGSAGRWLEVTDPLGGQERVEYLDSAPIPPAEDSAPAGVYNADLQFHNTFYWDKKAMAEAPGVYSKAQVIHWLARPDGKVTGIKHSEKKALESRVWYTYENQTDPVKVGKNALPIKIARLIEGGATQLSQYSYNALGNVIKETDPVGRVKTYAYDTNDIDVLRVYQRNLTEGASLDTEGQPADKMAVYTYNSLHKPLTETDAAGQVTIYTYNTAGQILTRKNAKNEITTYTYGDGGTVPVGYLASITSPEVNGVSAVTSFRYDLPYRSDVINEADQSMVSTFYDEINRKTYVLYPDGYYEQFSYGDLSTGGSPLDLGRILDRSGAWTIFHYNANRQMVSMTDPENRTTLYDWCTCGSLNSMTDPNGNVTTFHRDLQSRVYQKVFADGRTIDYLFEGQTTPNTAGATSQVKSATDALGRRTNYSYFEDDKISSVTYTNASGNPLNPPTPSVTYTYDNHSRLKTMTVGGTDITIYDYNPIPLSPGPNAGKLHTIDGPLEEDTISFVYDQLGRTVSQWIQGGDESTISYDSLGRVAATDNALGHFDRAYDGVTDRLQTLTNPTGQTTNYVYFGNDNERRLQTLQNLTGGAINLSTFNYAYYNDSRQIADWSRQLGTASSERWFEYDHAQRLLFSRNHFNPSSATQVNSYGYDNADNRTSDSVFNPQEEIGGTTRIYTPNNLNQIETIDINYGMISWQVYLSYDLAGNLLDDGQGRTFEWDAANRVRAINYGSQRSEFTYDGLSRRVKIVEKTGSTVTSTKQFVWVGNAIAQERDVHNTTTRQYFAEGEYRDKPFYYTRDHLGSIRELTNVDGTMVARYDYDPYGQRTKLSGTADVDFGYTGHYHHALSGLNLTLNRAYNPEIGRWLSRDPIEEQDGPNLYAYVHGNPINRLDPDGLKTGYFSTSVLAARAGALADLMAASGGRLARGAIEYAGWVCKSACGGPKPYYYTGPTRGHKGPTPDGRKVSTYSNPNEFEPCTPGDDRIGMHYAHPDGTGIPVDDQQVSNERRRPFMLARPVGGQFPTIKYDSHGSWP